MDKIIEISHLSKSYGDIKAVNEKDIPSFDILTVMAATLATMMCLSSFSMMNVWADKKGQRKNSNLRQRY